MSEIQARIDEAAELAREKNMTVTAFGGPAIERFSAPIVIRPNVATGSEWPICRSKRWIYDGPPTTEPLIQFTGNGYGSCLQGVDLRIADPAMGNLVGIQTGRETKNATIRNIRFEHRGIDCQGLVVRGHESLSVHKCEFRCSVPLTLAGGDNHSFTDLDLGTATTEDKRAELHSGALPCTCIWIRSMPHQWTFSGSQTWQGGDHAIYGIVDSASSGQVLLVQGARWEQPLDRLSEIKRAIHLEFSNRHLDRIALIGCRWTDRSKGVYVKGCWDVERFGSWLPGSFWWRRDP